MTLPLFSLGPLWTKHPPNGVLPATIETIIGYETSSYAMNPLGSVQGLLSRAQNMLFLCRSGGIAGSNIFVSANNGDTWTSVLMPATMKWLYVAWTGTMYVCITAGTTSQADKFAYSKDGYSWVLVGSFTNIFRRVGVQTNGTGGYIVPGFNTTTYQYTLDGGFNWVTTTAPLSPGSNAFFQFASDGQGTVIGVKSSGGSTYMRSIDSGVTFNLTTFPASMTADGTPINIFWDAGIYWVQTTPTKVWVSDDGSNWVLVNIATSTPTAAFSWARGLLDYGGTLRYAADRSSSTDINIRVADTIYGSPSSAAPLPHDLNTETIYSYDFTLYAPYRSTKLNSHRVTLNGLSGQDPGQVWQVASNGAGLIVGLNAGNGTRCWTSTDDGITWTAHDNVFTNSPYTSNSWWLGLVWDGTHFIAVVDYYQTASFCRHYYSTDGVTWTEGSNVLPSGGFFGTWAIMIPRFGGGAILMSTPTTGGGLPIWLSSATGTWTSGTSTTYVSSFSAWRGLAGDGAGNYVVCRKGDNVPNNPAIGWSSDNGVTWTYYEMTSMVDHRFVHVHWDGNQWIIISQTGNTGGNGITILTSDLANPTSPSDWRVDTSFTYNSTFNGISQNSAPSYQKAFTDGEGRSFAFSSIPIETTEGVDWVLRNHTPYNPGVMLSANLGPRAGYRSRVYCRADTPTVGSYSNLWYDTPMYPHIVFGEGSAGALYAGSFAWFIGDSGSPAVPNTVMGAALTAHDAFVTALGGSSSPETFEIFENGEVIDGVPLSSNGNTFTMESIGGVNVISTGNGRFNTTPGGSYLVEAGSENVLTFNFPANTAAFGFYITDVGDFVGSAWTLTIFDTALNQTSRSIPAVSSDGGLSFIGFIDTSGTTYTKATLSATGGTGDGVGVDDVHVMTLGAITPAAPSSNRPITRRASFVSELVSLGLSYSSNGFESLTTGGFTSATPIDISFGTTPTVNAKLRAKTSAAIEINSGLTFNTTAGGTKYVQTAGHLVIDFAIPVDAVGFYVTNAPRYAVTGSGNQRDRLKVIVTTSLGLTQTYKVPVFDSAARAGSLAFWGVVDPTRKIVSIRILPDNPAAGAYGIDDVIVGVNTATAVTYDPSLTANFIAAPTSGNAPLITQFEDTSGPQVPVAWWWDFNDDGYNERLDRISTPRYTFFEGTYTCRLMVRWLNGQFGTIVKPAYVTSTPLTPLPTFTGSPLTGVAPLTVQFIDTSTNFPTSWQWDFQNNGSIDSTVQNPSFTYTTAGTYTVSMRAANGAGGSTRIQTAYVTATQPPPVASFTASPISGAVPLTVNFTDTSTNAPTSWAWDFQNNGSTDDTSQNPSFTFTTAGSYTVKLTATNVGGSSTATNVISVGGGGSVGPMNFDVIPNLEDTDSYYNAGFDSSSTVGPGPAYGVTWYGAYGETNAAAHSASKVAGSFFEGDQIYMNYSAGFVTSVSFWIMADAPVTITTHSGTFGGGAVLNSVTLSSGSHGSLAGGTMVQVTVPAGGLAKSVVWTDPTFGLTRILLDDVIINL